jgi:hypothetical protein
MPSMTVDRPYLLIWISFSPLATAVGFPCYVGFRWKGGGVIRNEVKRSVVHDEIIEDG